MLHSSFFDLGHNTRQPECPWLQHWVTSTQEQLKGKACRKYCWVVSLSSTKLYKFWFYFHTKRQRHSLPNFQIQGVGCLHGTSGRVPSLERQHLDHSCLAICLTAMKFPVLSGLWSLDSRLLLFWPLTTSYSDWLATCQSLLQDGWALRAGRKDSPVNQHANIKKVSISRFSLQPGAKSPPVCARSVARSISVETPCSEFPEITQQGNGITQPRPCADWCQRSCLLLCRSVV